MTMSNDEKFQIIVKATMIVIGLVILLWGIAVDSIARVLGGLGMMFYGGLIGNIK